MIEHAMTIRVRAMLREAVIDARIAKKEKERLEGRILIAPHNTRMTALAKALLMQDYSGAREVYNIRLDHIKDLVYILKGVS